VALAGLTNRSKSNSETVSSTFYVADDHEIAERDQPKGNIIVYNLPGQANWAADKVKFTEVCKSTSDSDFKVVSSWSEIRQ